MVLFGGHPVRREATARDLGVIINRFRAIAAQFAGLIIYFLASSIAERIFSIVTSAVPDSICSNVILKI